MEQETKWLKQNTQHRPSLLVWVSVEEDCATTILPDKDDNDLHPTIGPILVVWGSGGERCTITILPDKDDKDYYQQYSHYHTTNITYHMTNITCLRL